MSAMAWLVYSVAAALGLALSGIGVWALGWAARRGGWREFERGATSIFDEREPLGFTTDRFPPPRGGRHGSCPGPAAPAGCVGD